MLLHFLPLHRGLTIETVLSFVVAHFLNIPERSVVSPIYMEVEWVRVWIQERAGFLKWDSEDWVFSQVGLTQLSPVYPF